MEIPETDQPSLATEPRGSYRSLRKILPEPTRGDSPKKKEERPTEQRLPHLLFFASIPAPWPARKGLVTGLSLEVYKVYGAG